MKDRIKRLKEVLVIQSESYKQWRMFAYIIRRLKAMNVNYFVMDGNIYATKGEAKVYPCAVSHMDTVHDIGEDLTILEVGRRLTGFNRVTMKQAGIGGDDKVGVYIALECLLHFKNFKAVFYRDEEVGCAGSSESFMGFFEDVSFVLQADRRGNSDFITRAGGTPLSSRNFKKAISPILKEYGYSCTDGMMTDVMALKENGLKVSCANISCGYYEPHMKYEYVDTKDVNNCLNMMIDMFTRYGETTFPHTHERIGYRYGYGGGWSKHDNKHSRWNNVTNRWDSEGDTYDWRKDYNTIDDTGAGKKRYVDMNEKEKNEFWKGVNTGKYKLKGDGSHDYSVQLNSWKNLSDKERQNLWDKIRPADGDEGEDFIGDGTDIHEHKPNYKIDGVFGYCDNCNKEKLVIFEKAVGGYLCQECRPLYIDAK